MEDGELNGNLCFKNDQNKFKPVIINGRTYRIVSKINPKYNPNSNSEQVTGFNNIKNAKEIEENDDVDSSIIKYAKSLGRPVLAPVKGDNFKEAYSDFYETLF